LLLSFALARDPAAGQQGGSIVVISSGAASPGIDVS
jgi:hypothetical protein